jgi:hypothetical protein
MTNDTQYGEFELAPDTTAQPRSLLLTSGLLALLLGKRETREHLAAAAVSAAEGTRDVALGATGGASQLTKTALNALGEGVTRLTQKTSDLAQDASSAVIGATTTAARTGLDVAEQVRDTGASATKQLRNELDTSVRVKRGRRQQKEERMAKVDTAVAAEVTKLLAKQEKHLRDIDLQLDALTRAQRRSRGGFPWGLVLLGAGGYYLYRNEGARAKAMDAVQNLNPGVKGNLERAGSALRSGVEAVRSGENPKTALTNAAQELRQGATKAVSNATEEVKDAGETAREGLSDLKAQTQATRSDPGGDTNVKPRR